MDKSKIAVDIFNRLASSYMEKFMNVDLYGDTFETFLNYLPENAELLEVACGPGNITRFLLNKRGDLKILATDLAPNMLELTKSNNPSVEPKLMDCRNIASLNKMFDGIMCGFALPYLSKEEAMLLIHDAAKILRPGGVLYISTMEDNYTSSGWESGSSGDKIFMHYHEAGYLKDALHKNNFKLVHESRKTSIMTNGKTVTDLILIATT